MDFRRSGQLDERRRRVLMDEIASPADSDATTTATGTTAAKGPIRAYPPSVLGEQQPRVTDLLPVRPLWVVVAVLLGLTGIATIEAIHVHVAPLALGEGQIHLAALDARQAGSLSSWFSSVLLAVAAISAVAIFGIRSHRVDDYRGRYRVWLWAAAALAWLSLDCATGVHEAIGLGLNVVAGRQLLSGTLANAVTISWLAVYGLIFGTLGLRLAVEVWPSRLSFVSLLTASIVYLIAGTYELEILSAPAWMIPGTVESLTVMVAHLSLVTAVGLYGRHVFLDATGRLKVHIDATRKPKAKSRAKLKVVKADKPEETKQRSASSAPSEPAKFGASSTSNTKPGASIAKSNVASPQHEDDEDDEDSYGDNLSKSERRRLKKLARREQRRAA